MGIFDKLFSTVPSYIPYTPKSEEEAWIAIMYACMEADGYASETEIKKLFQVLRKQPLFKTKHIADYYQPAMLAHRVVGGKMLVDASIPFISQNHKALLFSLIMELLLADGILTETEKEIAAYLTHTLPLETASAQKIVNDILA